MSNRKLTPQQEFTRRKAVLLTELEAASSQVLREVYKWSEEAIGEFLAGTRVNFQETPHEGEFTDLGRMAQHFGLAAGKYLRGVGFTPQQVDTWLGQMIAQARQNRPA